MKIERGDYIYIVPSMKTNQQLSTDLHDHLSQHVDFSRGIDDIGKLPMVIIFRPQGRPDDEFYEVVEQFIQKSEHRKKDKILITALFPSKRHQSFKPRDSAVTFKATWTIFVSAGTLALDTSSSTIWGLANLFVNEYGLQKKKPPTSSGNERMGTRQRIDDSSTRKREIRVVDIPDTSPKLQRLSPSTRMEPPTTVLPSVTTVSPSTLVPPATMVSSSTLVPPETMVSSSTLVPPETMVSSSTPKMTPSSTVILPILTSYMPDTQTHRTDLWQERYTRYSSDYRQREMGYISMGQKQSPHPQIHQISQPPEQIMDRNGSQSSETVSVLKSTESTCQSRDDLSAQNRERTVDMPYTFSNMPLLSHGTSMQIRNRNGSHGNDIDTPQNGREASSQSDNAEDEIVNNPPPRDTKPKPQQTNMNVEQTSKASKRNAGKRTETDILQEVLEGMKVVGNPLELAVEKKFNMKPGSVPRFIEAYMEKQPLEITDFLQKTWRQRIFGSNKITAKDIIRGIKEYQENRQSKERNRDRLREAIRHMEMKATPVQVNIEGKYRLKPGILLRILAATLEEIEKTPEMLEDIETNKMVPTAVKKKIESRFNLVSRSLRGILKDTMEDFQEFQAMGGKDLEILKAAITQMENGDYSLQKVVEQKYKLRPGELLRLLDKILEEKETITENSGRAGQNTDSDLLITRKTMQYTVEKYIQEYKNRPTNQVSHVDEREHYGILQAALSAMEDNDETVQAKVENKFRLRPGYLPRILRSSLEELEKGLDLERSLETKNRIQHHIEQDFSLPKGSLLEILSEVISMTTKTSQSKERKSSSRERDSNSRERESHSGERQAHPKKRKSKSTERKSSEERKSRFDKKKSQSSEGKCVIQ